MEYRYKLTAVRIRDGWIVEDCNGSDLSHQANVLKELLALLLWEFL